MEKINHPVHLIRCPHCRKGLYLPIIDSYKQICCPKCASVYSFQEYRFLDKSVEPKGEDGYLYRLRLQSSHDPAGQNPESISFQSKDSKLSFFKQDRVLVLRTKDSVAFLKNLTEGWSEYFHDSHAMQTFSMGVMSLAMGACGYFMVGWWGILAAPATGGLFYWLTQRQGTLRRKAIADQLQDARVTQEHLSFVAEDNENLNKLNEELEQSKFNIERLQAFREDQIRLGLSESSLNILNRAIAQLQESVGVMTNVAKERERRLDKIWLDIELRNLTARMPDSIIEYQLQSQQLDAQFQAELDAIAEVEVLLAGYKE